jgi:signal transduction histidine kinase
MLPDERTTHSNTLALPSDVEALVAAPGRGIARPLVTFLRSQNINVQTATTADTAFEEALLHPPDVILIDDRLPPVGGIELCQRLKGNVRTHFVPAIVFLLNDLRPHRLRALAAGADAVFAPSTDAQERRTRLWSLLRSRALHRQLERKQRSQGSEIVERRRWLGFFMHDLQGSVAALQANFDYLSNFSPAPDDPRYGDFQDSIEDSRTVFALLVHSVRTVTDFERQEAGQLPLHATPFSLRGLAVEIEAELRRHASIHGKSLRLISNGAIDTRASEKLVAGDRDLIKRAVMNLVLHAVRRGAPERPVTMDVQEGMAGVRLSVAILGDPLRGDRAQIFEPYAELSAQSVGYGLGLALARAVVELHGGRIWVDDVPPDGWAFVLELKNPQGRERHG